MVERQSYPPGWYPDANGLQCWWNGSSWTETLDFEIRPGVERSRLLMTEDGVSFGGLSHRWADVDRVRYSNTEKRINGAYMGTNYVLEVAGPGAKSVILMLTSGTSGLMGMRVDTAKRDSNHVVWSRAVEIIDANAGRRLVADVVRTVRDGRSAEFAGLRFDRHGVHKAGLFKKSLSWVDIAGTRVENSEVAVLIRKGAGVKPGFKIMRGGWNVVYVPRVIATLMQAP